jgi:hypothetical protein
MTDLVCVNPITWTQGQELAPAERHGGAVFFDTDEPALEPGLVDARCDDEGVLRVHVLGELERDFMSWLLLWVIGPGNYHPIEYQLFYVDLRNNARERVEAFVG